MSRRMRSYEAPPLQLNVQTPSKYSEFLQQELSYDVGLQGLVIPFGP
jgi:hypothetical protein